MSQISKFISVFLVISGFTQVSYSLNAKDSSMQNASASTSFDKQKWAEDLNLLKLGFLIREKENKGSADVFETLQFQFSKLHKAIEESQFEKNKVELLVLGLQKYFEFRSEDYSDDLLAEFVRYESDQPKLFSLAKLALSTELQSKLDSEISGYQAAQSKPD